MLLVGLANVVNTPDSFMPDIVMVDWGGKFPCKMMPPLLDVRPVTESVNGGLPAAQGVLPPSMMTMAPLPMLQDESTTLNAVAFVFIAEMLNVTLMPEPENATP